MAKLKPADFRNIALAGHASTGKTSLAECLLFAAKATTRLGKVDDGSSILDFEEQERERKNSIDSAVAHCTWQGKTIQIIDTPGYLDFVGDMRGALHAVETVVLIATAPAGLELNTRRAWDAAEEVGKARAIVINKVAAENAKFFDTLDVIQESLGRSCVPMTIPDAEGPACSKIISTLKLPADLAGDVADRASTIHEVLMESIVEADEGLMERYLEGETISDEELSSVVSKAIVEGTLVPVFATSASKELGITELLDTIAMFFPSPVDAGPVTGTKPDSKEEVRLDPSEDAPFSAQVFKVMSDPFVGKVTFFRARTGSSAAVTPLYLPRTGKSERTGGFFTVMGKEQQPVESVVAGQIFCTAKVDAFRIGDTVCDEKSPVVYPEISFPTPMVSLAVRPESRGDESRLSGSLAKLAEEDPTFRVERNVQTKEMIITGTSTLHLEIMLARLKARFNVNVVTHEPKIAYLETIVGTAEAKYRHKKQTGGRGQFAEVYLRLEANERGAGFEFLDEIVGGAVPRQFIPAVEKGLRETMAEGVIAESQVVDIKVALFDGSFHAVDSSEAAFKIATRNAFREGFLKAKPVLLEPIVNIEVTVPSQFMGDVTGDINGRRGRVNDVESIGDMQAIKAICPLAELQRYSTELRSMTGGQGSFTMEFSHYDIVPSMKQQQIVDAVQKAKEASR